MRRTRKPTITDVAQLAGVSRTSVSRVLNGRGELSEETRDRVLHAIETLGYRPSEIARSLSSQRSLTIGMVVYDILNPGLAEIVYSAQVELAKNGYQMILACMGGQMDAAQTCLSLLEDRRVDGIIVTAPIQVTDDNQLGTRHSALFGVTGTNCYDPLTGKLSRVIFDNVSGGRQVANHLIRLGHRQFGIVVGPLTWDLSEERIDGFRQEMAAHGIASDQLVVEVAANWTIPDGYAATHQLLDRAPEITAIFALYDIVAIGAIRALHDRGMRIPDDVAIIGYNDEVYASYTTPRLSSVVADCPTMGRVAAELMVAMLDTDKATPPEVVLPVKIVPRESSVKSP